MHRTTAVALLGAIVIAVAGTGAALAASTGPSVTVQIKTPTKTLRSSVVHGEKGWITKDGTPKGKCPGNSGAGALDAATHGRWTARYYSQYGDVLVTSILGVKPMGKEFWELVVNGKVASAGICALKLRAHEKILFKIAK